MHGTQIMTVIQSLLVIFAIVSVGALCEWRKIFNVLHIEGFEIFLFKIALPCYLFNATLHYDFAVLFHPDYIYSYLLAFGVVALITWFYFWKNSASVICIKMLASGYINSAFYALPVITFLLGDPKAGILSNLLQVIIIQPIFITLLSFINHKEKTILHRLSTPLLTPLILMPILGLLCNYFQFIPHAVLIAVVKNIGMSAPSLALFTFGLTLGGIKFSKLTVRRDFIILVAVKNIAHPFVAFLIGFYIFSLNHYWMPSLIIATSAPTAFLVYLIAKQFSAEPQMVKMVVAISSIASIGSLILIPFFLR